MEMTYESFVETLRSELLEATGYDAEMICYKQETEYPPTSGDRLLLKRQRNEEIMEVCALYVQDLYREYQNGWSMEEIVREIVERLDAIARSECFQRSRNLEDYDKIKEDLFIRLLNIEKNQVELEECIYRTIGDIALVLYARMGELNGSSASIKIKRHMLEKWEQEPKQVFEEALVVADEDWMTAVTHIPRSTAFHLLEVKLSSICSSLPPDTFARPSPITCIPYKNMARPHNNVNMLKKSIMFSFAQI